MNRRDYVLPNCAADYSFWQFMRTHCEAHLVVAEVKNLSRGPGKNEILQVANYLNPRGTGVAAVPRIPGRQPACLGRQRQRRIRPASAVYQQVALSVTASE